MSVPQFWKNRAENLDFRFPRWMTIAATSFFFATSLSAWTFSARYWSRIEEERHIEREKRESELKNRTEESLWYFNHSTKSELYPDDARPTDPWGAMHGSDAPIIDLNYENSIQPGYAPKF